MNVDVMLAHMPAAMLTEWMAYERVAGPIDRRYDQEALANIHEQLQTITHVLGAAHFTDEKHPDNPVPEPEVYPRPEGVWDAMMNKQDEMEE